MSKYTTEVRYICETLAGYTESQDYDKIDTVISKSRKKIFDFNYPIFDEAYKPVLETKILLHYYTREIGEETVALWKLRLKTKLNEIMPYFNKLYQTELLEFNPFYDADYHKEGTNLGNEDNTKNDNSHHENVESGSDNTHVDQAEKYNQWDLYSDTPQGGIDGIQQAVSSVGDNAYLTNARNIKYDGSGTNSDSVTTYGKTNTNDKADESVFHGTTTGEYTEHVYGKMPGNSYSKLLLEFRETFINIDMLVIDELKNLFINLW